LLMTSLAWAVVDPSRLVLPSGWLGSGRCSIRKDALLNAEDPLMALLSGSWFFQWQAIGVGVLFEAMNWRAPAHVKKARAAKAPSNYTCPQSLVKAPLEGTLRTSHSVGCDRVAKLNRGG